MTAIRWLTALLFLFGGVPACAHTLPGTAAMLDFRRDDVGRELDMPLDQFELSFRHPLLDDPMRR